MIERILKRVRDSIDALEDFLEWDYGSYYIIRFKEVFKSFARIISTNEYEVHARFNPRYECGELYRLTDGYVFARIRCTGEMGLPLRVVVATDSLTEEERATLEKMFLAANKDLTVAFESLRA